MDDLYAKQSSLAAYEIIPAVLLSAPRLLKSYSRFGKCVFLLGCVNGA
jgi:hypothetical protein